MPNIQPVEWLAFAMFLMMLVFGLIAKDWALVVLMGVAIVVGIVLVIRAQSDGRA